MSKELHNTYETASWIEAKDVLKEKDSPLRVLDVNWFPRRRSEPIISNVVFLNLNNDKSENPYGNVEPEITMGIGESFICSVDDALKETACKITLVVSRARLISINIEQKIDGNDEPIFYSTARFAVDDKQLVSHGVRESSQKSLISSLVNGYQAICAMSAEI